MIDDRYPAPRRLLKVTLLALFVTQFLVWPLTGTLDPHLGIAATEFVLLWFIVLYIKRNGLVAEDILLLNAVPISTLLITVPTALAGGILPVVTWPLGLVAGAGFMLYKRLRP